MTSYTVTEVLISVQLGNGLTFALFQYEVDTILAAQTGQLDGSHVEIEFTLVMPTQARTSALAARVPRTGDKHALWIDHATITKTSPLGYTQIEVHDTPGRISWQGEDLILEWLHTM